MIWNLSNTIIGFAIGVASIPFGGQLHLGYNSIYFTNVPFGKTGALTLGNVQLYNGFSPKDDTARYNDRTGPLIVKFGPHEKGHTFQSQVLNPFFLPVYLLTGGISAGNPFETAADDFATGTGSWWPWK